MSRLSTYISRLWQSRNKWWNSKQFLQYLVFVVIAGVFWCFMTFNQQMQQDVVVNLELHGTPKGITFIDDLPSTITVTVKDKGTSFLKMLFRRRPTLTLEYNKVVDSKNNMFTLTPSALQSQVKRLFRREATIIKVTPETISCRLTDRPAKRVPVDYFDNLDVTPDKRYVMFGDITCEPDSVLIYADPSLLANINEVEISTIRESNIDRTFERNVKLRAIDGVRMQPAVVKLTIPIEPLIQKRQVVPIQVRNLPEDINVIVFPGSVEATFLLPQSLYKKPTESFVAVVDYNSIKPNTTKAPISIGEVPAVFEGIKFATDSVEYIIERLNTSN